MNNKKYNSIYKHVLSEYVKLKCYTLKIHKNIKKIDRNTSLKEKYILVNKYSYAIYIINILESKNIGFTVNFSNFRIYLRDSSLIINLNKFPRFFTNENIYTKYISCSDICEKDKSGNKYAYLTDTNIQKIKKLLDENNIYEVNSNSYSKLQEKGKQSPENLKGLHYEILVTNELNKLFNIEKRPPLDNKDRPDAKAIIGKITVNFEITTSNTPSKCKSKQFDRWKDVGIVKENDLNIIISTKQLKNSNYFPLSFTLDFDDDLNLIINKSYKNLIDFKNNIKLQSLHGRDKYIQ